MSSETDHPRQRTVAELLAAHGDANATGRRRRRRADDDPDEGAPPAHGAPAADPPDWRSAPPREPDRPAAGDGLPPPQRGGRRPAGDEAAWDPDQSGAGHREADQWESAPWASAQRDPAQRASAQHDASPWDSGPREDAGWDAQPSQPPQPAQPSWDAAPRDARYPEPPLPRERAQRREPVEREPSRSWDREAPAEPRSSREAPPREAPAWESRAPEPGRNGREASRGSRSWDPAQPEQPPRRAAGAASADGPAAEPLTEPPTEQMPRVRATATPDPARTTRIQQQRRRPETEADPRERGRDDDGGPATMVGGAPAGAEAWHQARTGGRGSQPDADGPEPGAADDGPPTMVGGAPAGAEAWHRARTDGRRGAADGGPPTQAVAPPAFDDDDDDDDDGDYPAGLGGRGLDDEATGFFAPEEAEPERPVKRRAARTDPGEKAGSSPAWAAVIAQWIAGAIGGAALWVGFRFLWRDLPVVALAAAVLVTVGLVVVVRALLRSSDLRTTLFAVLVGLLLTVSPAILVLLGR